MRVKTVLKATLIKRIQFDSQSALKPAVSKYLNLTLKAERYGKSIEASVGNASQIQEVVLTELRACAHSSPNFPLERL